MSHRKLWLLRVCISEITSRLTILVGSGEPCFQGWPIRYFTNPYAFPSHCRVMSQDPSFRSRYPPPWGGFDPGPPSSQFLEAQTLPTELPGLGHLDYFPNISTLKQNRLKSFCGLVAGFFLGWGREGLGIEPDLSFKTCFKAKVGINPTGCLLDFSLIQLKFRLIE